MHADLDTSTSQQTRSGDTTSRASSEQYGDETLRKRSRAETSSGVVLACSLAESPLLDTNDPVLETLTLRCGVNSECLMSDSVRHTIGMNSCKLAQHRRRSSVLETHSAPMLPGSQRKCMQLEAFTTLCK
jgi:hypothetical protein